MYKLKTKQRLSFLMALAMLFSFTGIKVFANEPTTVPPTVQTERSIDMTNEELIDADEEIITISCNADGTYSSAANDSLRVSTLQIWTSVEYDDIYTTSDSRYFQEISNGTYLEVQPVSGELTSYSTYQTMENLGLPEEVMNGIAEMAVLAEETGNQTATVTTFIPVLDSSADASLHSYSQSYPRSVTAWEGKTFYHYVLYFAGKETRTMQILEGEDTTKDNLDGYIDLGVLIGTTFLGHIPFVNFFGIGWSWLDYWDNQIGSNIVYQSPANFIEFKIWYRLYHKYTYYFNGTNEIFGCRTQRAYLEELRTTYAMFTGEGMEGDELITQPQEAVESWHYADPEETAYINTPVGFFEDLIGGVRVQGNLVADVNFCNVTASSWPSGWPTRPEEP